MTEFEEKIALLQQKIDDAENIVFFGGAGVSTESGVPDFRSKDGLYNQHDVRFEDYEPEFLLSRNCLDHEPEVFFEFYRQKLDCRSIKPNITHEKLAELEARGKHITIITQNIDGLHQKAGSKHVLEIHGTTARVYCEKCHKQFEQKDIFDSKELVPRCECGGKIRPDIVLYGEYLPDVYYEAQNKIDNADLIIVAGTSLTVYPAANLISAYHKYKTVIVNHDATEKDRCACLVLHNRLGEVFSQLK